MALTSLKLSHIQLVFKQLVLLYSIRHDRNFLRRVLFLQARVCEQLCRSGRRLGVRLPYRRRPGRVRARAPCRSGIEPYSRHGRRRTGAFRRRHSGHGFLGRPDLGNRRRRHGAYYRRRAYGHLYPALRHAPASETHYRLRKVARTNPFRARALSRSAGLRARGMPAFRIPPQRSRRSRQSARSGGSGRYVPSGMGVRPSPCRRYRSGALRPASNTASAGHVRQESHVQDRRRGRLRLRRDSTPDRTGPDRHRAAYYAPFSTEPYRRGLSPFRKPAGRSNQSGDRMRQITATAPTIDIPII